jgi:hypothetical protein
MTSKDQELRKWGIKRSPTKIQIIVTAFKNNSVEDQDARGDVQVWCATLVMHKVRLPAVDIYLFVPPLALSFSLALQYLDAARLESNRDANKAPRPILTVDTEKHDLIVSTMLSLQITHRALVVMYSTAMKWCCADTDPA